MTQRRVDLSMVLLAFGFAFGGVVACGDSSDTSAAAGAGGSGNTSSASGGNSSSATIGSGVGGSGVGGSGGNGSGVGGSGGNGMGGPLLNGCTKATASDQTGNAVVVISTMGFAYTPACMLVDAGTTIQMKLKFGIHPTLPGSVENGIGTIDEGSPIPTTTTGESAEFAMPDAGAFPYFCNSHLVGGMLGVIYVE
jgi:plastocyanin